MKKNEKIVKLVKGLLIVLPTLYLGAFLTENFIGWYNLTFNKDEVVVATSKENYIYLFSFITCVLNLLLVYFLSFYYKINKKWLKRLNMIIFLLSVMFMSFSIAMDYSIYNIQYDNNIIYYIAMIVLYYLPFIPSSVILLYDKYQSKK